MNAEELYTAAKEFIDNNVVSPSRLQRVMEITSSDAMTLSNELSRLKIIEPFMNTRLRKVLIKDRDRAKKIIERHHKD